MKRFIVSAVAATLALTLITSTPHAGSRIVVVSKATNTLQVFDAESYKLVGTVETGEGPHEVVTSLDGRYAYVGDFDSRDNTVSIIELGALKRVGTINVKPQWGPHALAINRAGAALDGALRSPLPDWFDSWVLHLRRRK